MPPPATPGATPAPLDLPTRARVAVAAGRAVAAASRLTRLGEGSVIGGRVALALDPALLAHLTERRQVALVSATNGKTTTTRLLTAALATDRPVVANLLGANMPPGHVAALGADRRATTAVLEVDERWLGHVAAATAPTTVVLMNLSRDQLDRSHEVRQVGARWRAALAATPPDRVVANADDPIVTWAASAAPEVVWVGTGTTWRADATSCPACTESLTWSDDGWACGSCGLHRPAPELWLAEDGSQLERRDGPTLPLRLSLPGRANRMNAAMALAAAVAMGADPEAALAAMAEVDEVAGRYRSATVAGARIRLLLAKNPAGWHEALDMLGPPPRPVVVAINARVADGHDPSWLWDVPFERLAGRRVVAAGERRHDLAVRLRYAEVDHVVAGSLIEAVRAAGGDRVDVAANYTAFQGYLDEVGR